MSSVVVIAMRYISTNHKLIHLQGTALTTAHKNYASFSVPNSSITSLYHGTCLEIFQLIPRTRPCDSSRFVRSLKMDSHHKAVAKIEASIREFHDQQRPFRIYHGSTNSTRASTRRLDNSIDTSMLNRVLEIDTKRKTVLAEPNVP